MDLRELLELMTQMAEVTETRVCLGIRVCEDGSGQATRGSRLLEEAVDCPHGKSKLEWDNPTDGARQLEGELRRKLLSARHARQITEQE